LSSKKDTNAGLERQCRIIGGMACCATVVRLAGSRMARHAESAMQTGAGLFRKGMARMRAVE